MKRIIERRVEIATTVSETEFAIAGEKEREREREGGEKERDFLGNVC